MSQLSRLAVRLVQLDVAPAQPDVNMRRMLRHIAQAQADGIELIVFPEMAIPGYLLGDEWEYTSFLRECERCTERIVAASRGLCCVFGNVGLDWERHNEDGRVRKYNALFVADDGKLAVAEGAPYPFVIKTLMPNYREFDDSRHFYDLRKLALELGQRPEALLRPVCAAGVRLGCVLCEDGWDIDYALSPLRALAAQDIDIFVNISASPFTCNKNHKRNRVFSAQARTFSRPLLYVNQVGLQNNGKTVFAFDGSSCVYDARGAQRVSGKRFVEDCLTVQMPLVGDMACNGGGDLPDDDIGSLCEALLFGAKRFMHDCGIERVVVGASGGIDSAVTAALYAAVIAPENLLLVNMPSRYNSATTRGLATQLATRLACRYAEIPIEESIALTARQINGLQTSQIDGADGVGLVLSSHDLENVQARDRSARVLAAVASAFGGVFTCNANKSEMTVGYSTLYGDLGGFLALLADLWKGEVYALGRYLNERVFHDHVIPEGVFSVVPSAELSVAQSVDEGRGDPLVYPYHDRLFASWIERWNRVSPEEILQWYADGTLERRLGYDGLVSELFATPQAFVDDLERWWNLYQGMAVAKRIQAPPIMAVKRRAFGFDHREAQMPPRYTQRYRQLKTALLGRCAAGDGNE